MKRELIKCTNPSESIIDTDSTEEKIFTIEMSITGDATCSNMNRILEDVNVFFSKTHQHINVYKRERERNKKKHSLKLNLANSLSVREKGL